MTSSTNKLFIAIEGPIGAGKSTLAKLLVQYLDNYIVMEEPLSGSVQRLRTKFYKDMNKWAFHLQIKMFQHRYKQHIAARMMSHGVIQDRSIYGDKPFAYLQYKMGTINDEEIEIYEELWTLFKNFLVYPDLMIFLKVDIDTLLERINKRGRPEEANIDRNYLIELQHYIDYLHSDMVNNGVRCLYLDWNENNMDKVRASVNELAQLIKLEENRLLSPWKRIRNNQPPG